MSLRELPSNKSISGGRIDHKMGPCLLLACQNARIVTAPGVKV
jgi:hypothetical protein